MKPILNDLGSCDDYMASVRKNRKSTEDQEKEVIYRARCHMVALSRNYPAFVEYIRENAHIFARMDDAGKECMRRLCQESMLKYAVFHSHDDVELFDRVFGHYIPANRSSTIFEGTPLSRRRDDTPKTLDEQVVSYTNTAYQTFIEWISDPIIQAQLAERPDLHYRVNNAIEVNRLHNFVPVPKRGYREYHPDDEQIFSKVLNSMKR